MDVYWINICVKDRTELYMDIRFYCNILRPTILVGVKLKKYVYLGIVTILIIMTYKATLYKHGKVFTVINNSSLMTSGKQRFTYADEDVYTAIKKIRFSNCFRKHQRIEQCVKLKLCDQLSEENAVDDCEGAVECHPIPVLNETTAEVCKRRLPKAVIIGTYKSGTRELIDFLAMNPSVVIKRRPKYEVSYFDRQADKDLSWYRGQMPFSYQGQITLEKSPGYFSSDQAPRRIFEMDKDIKLILIVRNPVDRAISHLTFEDFITKEQYGNDINNCFYKHILNRKVINKNCFAVKGSIYDKPLERYLKYFALEQIHIIDAAEFIKQPCAVLQKLEHFLNIDHYINCNNFVNNKDKGVYCVQDSILDAGEVSCYGSSRGRVQPNSILGSLKDQLRAFFQPHNERLFTLVGKRFVWE